MAQKSDIQYIYYVDGSAARKTALTLPKMNIRKPIQFLQEKKFTLRIDPLAHTGIVTATLMLVLLCVGWFQLQATQAQIVTMESYVQELEQTNVQLKADYQQAYDLEVVERTALAMGMVSVEEVPHVTIQVKPPVQEVEPSGWDQFTTFLSGLLA